MHIGSITTRVLLGFCSQSPAASHFTLLSSTSSADLKLKLHQYAHRPTNARIYHFENSDPENAFASVVKTYVLNDSGCPHILEHLATCGSERYPVRDPFFNMLRRSVNTYMNAWTGDDFTSYPFSSANPADWRNLYHVYLDMTLRAALHELDFRQEGWRYEITPNGQKELKGIVLNEMKGAYQDSDRQLMREINQELFAGTPYVFDSGGRPADIVNLEYSELKKMYHHYYHPSNMAFYFYGNAPIAQSLQYLHAQYLHRYSDQSHRYNDIALAPAPIAHRHKTIISHTSETNNISINYRLPLTLSPLHTISLRLLTYLLLEKSNAKLYQRFIESGTTQNIGFSGFNQAKIPTFTFTLKGVFPEYTCQQLEDEFRSVLQEIMQNGIEKDRLQEFAHQFEVNLLTPRENNGIRMLEQSMTLMNHRLNFDLFLNPRPFLEQAIQKLQQPDFLKEFINRFFLQNSNVSVVRQMVAESELNEEPITSKVQMEDTLIKKQQEQLQARQNQKQNADILPMLRLADITKPVRKEPVIVSVQQVAAKRYEQYHVKIAEDINFYRLVFNFHNVDSHFLHTLTLWMHTLNRIISTHSYSYNELTAQLANHTAGFNVFHAAGNNHDLNVVFQFSCLKKNVSKAFQLLQDIIFSPKYEKEHTLNAFKSFTNEATEGLIENPMNECLSEAAGHLTRTAAMLNTYKRIKESFQMIKNQQIEDFYQLSLRLGKCNNIKLIEHSNDKSLSTPPLIQSLLNSKGQEMAPFQYTPHLSPKAVTYSYMVNFCTQQYKAPKYLSHQHAHINLLLEMLQQDYLHPLIREKGGAYGTAARIRNNGTIALSSYLDPNTLITFQAFDNSIHSLLSKDRIEEVSLLQAKIKQFGEVDRVKIPQIEGVSQILKGYTKEEYESFREALKHASFKDMVETGRTYLIDTPKSRCLFGRVCPQGFEEEKLRDFLL